MVLRNQKETRQAQLFMQVYNQFTMEKYKHLWELMRWEWKDYDDLRDKYSGIENRQKMSAINSWFEGLGVLVRSDLVPIGLVVSFIGEVILNYWEKYGPYILEVRVRRNSSRIHREMEYLYNTTKAYLEEHPELNT
jgi:hypothetical protein